MRNPMTIVIAGCCSLLLLLTSTGEADARRGRRQSRTPKKVRPAPAPTPPTTPPAVLSKKAQASALLKRGLSKLQRGFYYEAIEDFKKGLALFESPSFYYNMGLAYQELRKYVPALGAFESYVAKVKNRKTNYHKLAREWIKILHHRIATVRVTVNVTGARVTVAGRTAGTSPNIRVVRIQPEKNTLYDIKVSKPGHETESGKDRQVRLEPGKSITVTVKLITSAEATRRRQEYQREVKARRRIQERLRRARATALRAKAKRRRQLRLGGWGLVITGAAVAVAGGALGIVSLVDTKYVESSAYSSQYDKYSARFDRAVLLSKVAWASIGSGVVIAAAGAILVWWSSRRPETNRTQPGTPPPTKPRISLLPSISPQGASMTLKLRFSSP